MVGRRGRPAAARTVRFSVSLLVLVLVLVIVIVIRGSVASPKANSRSPVIDAHAQGTNDDYE